jgi:hypothetical protein
MPDEFLDVDQLSLKFAEGTRIRIRDGDLVCTLNEDLAASTELLDRQMLDEDDVAYDLADAVDLLDLYRVEFYPAFDVAEETLDDLKASGESRSGRELADLNTYVLIDTGHLDGDDLADLTEALIALPSVELIVADPYSEPPIDADLTWGFYDDDPDYIGQEYLFHYPIGVDKLDPYGEFDIPEANVCGGADGDEVQVVDIESDWNRTHEDVPFTTCYGGVCAGAFPDHGTMVLGVLGAPDDGHGVVGIVPDADFGIASRDRVSTSVAMYDAFNEGYLEDGDVILLETQYCRLATPP